MVRRRRRKRRPIRTFFILVVLAAAAAICYVNRALIVDWVSSWLVARPPGIIVHHSASPPSAHGRLVDAAALDRSHAQRGFSTWYRGKCYHIGYHFVILQDGTVQEGRPIGCRGAHTHGKEIYNRYVGICLVGDFSSRDNPAGKKGPVRPSRAQMDALAKLCRRLMKEYQIPVSKVMRHRDFNQTECPGDRFPYGWLLERLRV